MNAQDRIKKAHVAIMRHKKFCAYAGLLTCGKVEMTNAVPTACTNGWDVTYNPEFVDSLTDPQLRLLVLHEATHKAYQHLIVWRSLWEENPRLTNVAADHFVNLALITADANEGFLVMPENGAQPEKRFTGMSVKQIYDVLKNEDRGGSKGKGKGKGEGLDSHDWKNATSNDPAEAKRQADEIQRAIRQGEALAKKMGRGAGNADGVFGELLAPRVDWKQALRGFVTEHCAGRDESSWRKPNRRYLADDVYMPSMEGVTMQELVVVLDTSGSCFGSDEMTRFVSELSTLIEQVKPAKCHVLYVDSNVAGHQVFEDGQFAVQNVNLKGGGGTDMPAAFDYCAQKRINPSACVILTDGYTPWGAAPGYPVLWAITTSSITAPYGVTIHVEV